MQRSPIVIISFTQHKRQTVIFTPTVQSKLFSQMNAQEQQTLYAQTCPGGDGQLNDS